MVGLGDKQSLSPLDESMANLMELSSIPQAELDELERVIDILNNQILIM